MRKFLIIAAAAAAALMLCSCSLLKYGDSSEESRTDGYEIPVGFTEEEMEIQTMLEEAAKRITTAFCCSEYALSGYPEYKVVFIQPGDENGVHAEKLYKLSYSDYRDLDDFTSELKEYFLTDESLEMLAENFAVAEKVDREDPDYDFFTIYLTVTEGDMLDENGALTDFPHLIICDTDTLCSVEASEAVDALNRSFWSTAHITEKTDDKIKFAYIVENDGILTERTGILKGQKLSWYLDWLE